jgi:hypothetical protein
VFCVWGTVNSPYGLVYLLIKLSRMARRYRYSRSQLVCDWGLLVFIVAGCYFILLHKPRISKHSYSDVTCRNIKDSQLISQSSCISSYQIRRNWKGKATIAALCHYWKCWLEMNDTVTGFYDWWGLIPTSPSPSRSAFTLQYESS